MPATISPDRPPAGDYEARRAAVERRVKLSDLSRAEIARRLGYDTESGSVYVRSVIGGHDTSAPMLARIEGVLDAAERAASPSGGAR